MGKREENRSLKDIITNLHGIQYGRSVGIFNALIQARRHWDRMINWDRMTTAQKIEFLLYNSYKRNSMN